MSPRGSPEPQRGWEWRLNVWVPSSSLPVPSFRTPRRVRALLLQVCRCWELPVHSHPSQKLLYCPTLQRRQTCLQQPQWKSCSNKKLEAVLHQGAGGTHRGRGPWRCSGQVFTQPLWAKQGVKQSLAFQVQNSTVFTISSTIIPFLGNLSSWELIKLL